MVEPETTRRRLDATAGETAVEMVAAVEQLDTCEEEEELYDYGVQWANRQQWANRITELDKLESFPVFERVDVEVAEGKYVLTGTWVDKVDKSRWAAREYATEKSDDFFAPTPVGVADNLIELVAVKTGNPMVIGDVSSAFCHAPELEEVYMWPPKEDLDRMKKRYPHGFRWRMLRQLYGRRRAGQT